MEAHRAHNSLPAKAKLEARPHNRVNIRRDIQLASKVARLEHLHLVGSYSSDIVGAKNR